MRASPATVSLIAGIVGVSLLLGGCGERRDDGPVVTETLTLDAFKAIDVEGGARLEITIGDAQSVVMRGKEKALRRVNAKVSGDTLRIRARGKDWVFNDSDARLTFTITMPRLEKLRLEGGNDVNVVDFAGGETEIRASGAVNINANGHLEKLTVRMTGAGHADLSRLVADAATVTVDGVGNVIVNPRESLNATMNGVGAIFYTGSPSHVTTRMNGLGTIGKRDSSPSPDAERRKEIDPDALQPERDDPNPKKKQIADEKDVTEVI